MYCTNCGQKITKNENFCSGCGKEIKKITIEKVKVKSDRNKSKKRIFKILGSILGLLFIIGIIYFIPVGVEYLDDLSYTNARKSNTIESYKAYISRHKNGKHLESAKNSIYKLQDKISWENVLEMNTIEGYEKYLSTFKNGSYITKAQQKIDEILIIKNNPHKLPIITCNNKLYMVLPKDLSRGYNFDDAYDACKSLEAYGYSDWKVPFLDLLVELYKEKDRIGGFSERASYWTCNSYVRGSGIFRSDITAYFVDFSNGRQNRDLKGTYRSIRPIREYKFK